MILFPLFLCALAVASAAPKSGDEKVDEKRSKTNLELPRLSNFAEKFFGVKSGNDILPRVKVVTFENTPCIAHSGLVGTCYSAKECENHYGSNGGSCANGYGVCCVITATCDAVIKLNNTYFQSPGYPSTHAIGGMCMVELWAPKGTVQIKLDFLFFDIAPPVDGDCGNDTFIITGANPGLQIPILCGYNSGQHMYIDIDNAHGPHKIIFSSTGIPHNRNFNILVSYLSDYDPCKAPPRCLQYYTDISGTICSFNYAQTTPQLLNNAWYSLCFAYNPGYCDIGFAFTNVDMGVEDTTEVCQVNACIDDYIGFQGFRLCGTLTGTTVQANATGPIVVHVHSNADNSLQQQGFVGTYMNLPC